MPSTAPPKRNSAKAWFTSRGRNGRGHRLRVDADFSWCVDTGIIGNNTDIAPFVGIRSDAIEAARADLMALPRDEWVATVIGNVGYVLGGEYK
jgi:hypothetical protein